MSTFDGIIREYPLISIDRFLERKNYDSTTYFLSHCHSDHMYGLSDAKFFYLLQSRGFSKIYVSDVSYHLLKNNESYQHLSDYLVQLPLEVPTLINVYDTEGREVLKVTVTLLTAGHCPGSMMFFIEGDSGNVLYTGDFRLPVGSAARLSHLHETKDKVKPLKSLYIDTTFCKEKNLFIPSREECLNKILEIVEPWLSKGPNHIVYFLCPYELAYEFVFVELWKRFGLKTHVTDEWEKKYTGIKSLEDAITSCASEARIHACLIDRHNRLAKYIKNSYQDETPCGFTSSDGKTVHIIKIKPSAMFFTKKEFLCISEENKKFNFHRVYYSTHPSLSEIQDMVYYLRPNRVFPNVVQEQTVEEILDLIFLHDQAKTAESDKENSDISSLGKLKSPSIQDTTSEEDFSLPFFDEEYTSKLGKKSMANSSAKGHESRVKVNICIDTDFDNTEEQETMLREEIYSQKVEAKKCRAINKSPLKWQNPIESSDEEIFVSSCEGLSDENPDKAGSDIIFGTPEEERVNHFDDENEKSAGALTPASEGVKSSASESLIDEQYLNYLCDIKYHNNWAISEKRKNQIDMEYSKICEADNDLERCKIDVKKDKTEYLESSCNAFEQKKNISVDNICVVPNSNVYHAQSEYSKKVDQQSETNEIKTVSSEKEGNTDVYNISQHNKKSNDNKILTSKRSSHFSKFECLSKGDDKIKSNENKIEKSKTANSTKVTLSDSSNVNCSEIKNSKISESNNVVKICESELVKNKIEGFNTYHDTHKQSKGFSIENSNGNYNISSNKVVSNNNASHSKFEFSKEAEKEIVMKTDAKSFNLAKAESSIKNPNSFTFIRGKTMNCNEFDKNDLNKTDLETHGHHITDTSLEQEDKIINKKLALASHKTSDALMKPSIKEAPAPYAKNGNKKSKSFRFVKKIYSSSSESEDEYTFKHVKKIPKKNKTNNLSNPKSLNPNDHKHDSCNNSIDKCQKNQLKNSILNNNNSEMKCASDTKIASVENNNFRNNKSSSDTTNRIYGSDLASVSNQNSLVKRINSNLPSNSALQTSEQVNIALNAKSQSQYYASKASSSHTKSTSEQVSIALNAKSQSQHYACKTSSSYTKSTSEQVNIALNAKSQSQHYACKASSSHTKSNSKDFSHFSSNIESKNLKIIHSNKKNGEVDQQNSLDVKEFKNERVRALPKLSDHGNHEVDVMNLDDTSSSESSGVKNLIATREVQTGVVTTLHYKDQESEVKYATVNSDISCTSNKQNFSSNAVSKTDTYDKIDKNNSKKCLCGSIFKESSTQLCNACIKFGNPDKSLNMGSDNKISNQIDCIPNSSQNKLFENILTLSDKSSSQSSSDSSVIIEEINPSSTVNLGNEYQSNDRLSLYQNGISNNTTAWEIKSVSQSGSNVIVEEVNSSSDIDDSPSLIAPIIPKTSLNNVSSSSNSFTVSKRRRIDFSEVGPSSRTEGCDNVCDNYVIDSDSTPEIFENVCSHNEIAVKKPILEIIIDDDW